MSDQEMLQGLLARDETALRQIYEIYGNYLRRIVGNILESPEDAEELLNIDANLYFHAVDLNLYANVITQEARPYGIIKHNSVKFFFTHNEIAYTGFISLALGGEIQAEEAFESAAEILSRLR